MNQKFCSSVIGAKPEFHLRPQPRMPTALALPTARSKGRFGYANAERMRNPLAGAERMRNPLAGAGGRQNLDRRYRSKHVSAPNEGRQAASAERMCLHGKWGYNFYCLRVEYRYE
ncbi:MAG: hypothetical protein LBK66_05025 [Spirochaetaceae bacterium]|nr:hypothetical protein [Spirochaetaceae bacterium]